jgi:DNA-binding response OmpR family regulator
VGDAPIVPLVDDQPEISKTLTRFLNLKGYAVEIPTSLVDARPLLEATD